MPSLAGFEVFMPLMPACGHNKKGMGRISMSLFLSERVDDGNRSQAWNRETPMWTVGVRDVELLQERDEFVIVTPPPRRNLCSQADSRTIGITFSYPQPKQQFLVASASKGHTDLLDSIHKNTNGF
jgi:hypothetical protein